MARVLIIGAGCTGAATSMYLRQSLGKAAAVHVWEKARGAGGRFSTSKHPYPDGLRADMGAQYASVNASDAISVALMKELVDLGAARLVDDAVLSKTSERAAGTLQYQGTDGQNGLVKAMLQASSAEVMYEKRVSKIDKRGSTWTVSPYGGAPQDFDCVILCVPGCGVGGDNLNKIHGNWEKMLTDTDWAETEVPHDCRYSLALWLKAGTGAKLEAFFGDVVEKQVDGKNIELLVWQSRKDGEPTEGAQAIVMHTAQGAKGNKQSAERGMTAEVCKMLGIQEATVESSKIITWFQSQVSGNPKPRQPCLVACESPALILAGDYLTASNFSGCACSASAAAASAYRLLAGGPSKTSAKSEAGNPGEVSPKSQSRKWGPSKSEAKSEAGYPAEAAPKSQSHSSPSKGSGKSQKCTYCGKSRECFLDKSDGAKYCGPCWKEFYGKDPPGAARVA